MSAHRHAPPDYECPFCAFVSGEELPPWNLRQDVVWQDSKTTAWMNPRWWVTNPGNVLVVPNEHVENLFELDGGLAAAVHATARRIALAMTAAYPCEGVTTRQNNGPGADQEVWHYHLHVFPRDRGDGFYGSNARLTDPEERQPYAELLKAAL
ncbi:MAG TPA: HIT family protein [Gaiellaceae bacterium]|nr:HIT family protein [Gaiellaceae bacterium]